MRILHLPLAAGVLAAAALIPRDAAAQTAGINMGAPVYDGVVAIDAAKAAVGTGAAHVRVNFRLDKWKSPNDTNKINGRTFFEAYACSFWAAFCVAGVNARARTSRASLARMSRTRPRGA